MNRQEIFNLAQKTLHKGDPTSWFETLYADSNGDTTNVPWADLKPNPHLLDWLKQHKTENSKGIVVGCGLGDDAESLAQHGFQTTSFDVSKTAVEWCKKRFPKTRVHYQCENLFSLPASWKQSFDFVFEAYTVQALPKRVQKEAIHAVGDLVGPNGKLLVVSTGQMNEEDLPGPPWPLHKSELDEYTKKGLKKEYFKEIKETEGPFPITYVGCYSRG